MFGFLTPLQVAVLYKKPQRDITRDTQSLAFSDRDIPELPQIVIASGITATETKSFIDSFGLERTSKIESNH